MQELPNGDLIFARKGPPPEVPFGYVRDEKEPYVLRRIHEPCKYFERRLVKCGKCPHGRMKDYCTFWDGMVNRRVCIDCQGKPEPDVKITI